MICSEYLFTTLIIDYILFKIIFNDFNMFSTEKKILTSKEVKHLLLFHLHQYLLIMHYTLTINVYFTKNLFLHYNFCNIYKSRMSHFKQEIYYKYFLQYKQNRFLLPPRLGLVSICGAPKLGLCFLSLDRLNRAWYY